VLLRIHPELLPYFEWYLTGRYENLGSPDQRGWILMQVLFYWMDEACMHLLSMGTSAEVMEPLELVSSVVEAARVIIDHHGQRAVKAKSK
jgi:predicted DNA-binding transcriptional regulator YafY